MINIIELLNISDNEPHTAQSVVILIPWGIPRGTPITIIFKVNRAFLKNMKVLYRVIPRGNPRGNSLLQLFFKVNRALLKNIKVNSGESPWESPVTITL